MSKGPGQKDALTVALKFLSSRPRSIKEVRDRLGDKGYGAEEIDKRRHSLGYFSPVFFFTNLKPSNQTGLCGPLVPGDVQDFLYLFVELHVFQPCAGSIRLKYFAAMD